MKKILTALLLCFTVNQIQTKDVTLLGITFEKKAITEGLQSVGLPVDQINSFFASIEFYKNKASELLRIRNDSDYQLSLKFTGELDKIQKEESKNYQSFFKIATSIVNSSTASSKDISYTSIFINLFLSMYLDALNALRYSSNVSNHYLDKVLNLIGSDAFGQRIFDNLVLYFKIKFEKFATSVWPGCFGRFNVGQMRNSLWKIPSTNADRMRTVILPSNSIVINPQNIPLRITNNGLQQNSNKFSVAAGVAVGVRNDNTMITDRYMAFLQLGSMQGPAGYTGVFIDQCYKKVTIESTELSNVALGIYVQKGVELQLKNVKITTQGDLNAQALQSFKSSDGISISNLHNGIYLEEGAVLKVQNVTVNGNKLSDTL